MDGLPRGCCEASNTDAALGNCVGSTEGINDGSAGGIVLGYGMGELLGMSDGLVVVGRSDWNAMSGIVPFVFDSVDSEEQAQARSIYKDDVAEFREMLELEKQELSEIRQKLSESKLETAKDYLESFSIKERERDLKDQVTCNSRYVDYIDSPDVKARRSKFLAAYAGVRATGGGCKYDINGWPANIAALKLVNNIRSRGTLIICPVSLVGQWAAEVSEKVAGNSLKVHNYYDRYRERSAMELSNYDIVITTYETLAKDMSTYSPMRCEATRPPLLQINWHRIIFDESHHKLMTDSTLFTKAAQALCSKRRWMVTGTPFQGHVKSISTQCSCLGVYSLDTESFWYKMMADDFRIVSCNAMLRRIMIRHSNAMTYKATGFRFTDLPAKVEEQVDISLSAVEMQDYNLLQEKLQLSYLRMQKKGIEKYKVPVSKLIKELQKACSGIASSSSNNSSGNNDDDDDRDGNIEVKRLISDRGLSVDVLNMPPCAKLTWLMDKLQYIRDYCPEAKVLIFSQFTSTFKRNIGPLIQSGYQFRTLTNNMKAAARTKALSDFRNDPPTTIFLLCMRAGSVGLNLTEANHVILMDPCINKQVEYQAVGRVYRIGQRREVKIYRLACLGTVEERIMQMHLLEEVVSEESTAGSLRVDRVSLSDARYRTLLCLPPAEDTATDAQVVVQASTTTLDQDDIISPDLDNSLVEEDDGVNLEDQSNQQSKMMCESVDMEESFNNTCLADEAQHLNTFQTPTLSSSMTLISESIQIDDEYSPLPSNIDSSVVYLPVIGMKRLRKRQRPIRTIHQRGIKTTPLRIPIEQTSVDDLRDSDEELVVEDSDDAIPIYWQEEQLESPQQEEVHFDPLLPQRAPWSSQIPIPSTLNTSALKQTLRTLSDQLQPLMADPPFPGGRTWSHLLRPSVDFPKDGGLASFVVRGKSWCLRRRDDEDRKNVLLCCFLRCDR